MRTIFRLLLITLFFIGTYTYRVTEKPILNEKARAGLPGSFVKLKEGIVHYELSGPEEGELVVLVHGFSTPLFVWDKTVPALVEAGYRVLRYDHYGRGYSDRPSIAYTLDLYDSQLIDLLETLKLKTPAHLIGLSMGGGICVYFSDNHPEKVKSLTLFAPLSFPAELTFAQEFAKTPLIGDYIVAWYGASMIRDSTRTTLYQFDNFPEFMVKFDEQLKFRGVEPALLSSLRHLDFAKVLSAYPRVAQQHKPVLLVWGRQDTVLPFTMSTQVRELLPAAQFLPMEATGHTPHYERPEVVNPQLIEFLKGAS